MNNETDVTNPWDVDLYSDNTGSIVSKPYVSAAVSIVGNLKPGSPEKERDVNNETKQRQEMDTDNDILDESAPPTKQNDLCESLGVDDNLGSRAEEVFVEKQNIDTIKNEKTDYLVDEDESYQESSTISDFDSFTTNSLGDSKHQSRAAVSKSTSSDLKDSRSEVSSVHGPMWAAANQLLVLDEKEIIADDNAMYEKYQEQRRRHNVPKSLRGVHTIESVKKFKQETEQRNELRQKKKEISNSLLSRAKTRADVGNQAVVKTAVPSSLFRAAKEKDIIRTMEEVDGVPQHHGVGSASSKDVIAVVDDSQLINTTPQVARRRRRVIQLFLFGLLGTVGGLSGSIFAQLSCHFVSAKVLVGDRNNGAPFQMHFGMWKYTPIDSVFQGYSYCYSYDDDYASSRPYLPRISGLVAISLGTITLCVLWAYIVVGQTKEAIWKCAAYFSFGAFLAQLVTYTFFLGDICRSNSCSFGPGAIISVMATVIWLFLSNEMFSNIPLIKKEGGILPKFAQNGLTNEAYIFHEMRDQLQSGLNQTPFCAFEDDGPKPSLSSLSKKSQRSRSRGRGDIEMQDPYRSYVPPTV